MSKGSKQRPTNHTKFGANYDAIFNKKKIAEGIVLVKRAETILDDMHNELTKSVKES